MTSAKSELLKGLNLRDRFNIFNSKSAKNGSVALIPSFQLYLFLK